MFRSARHTRYRNILAWAGGGWVDSEPDPVPAPAEKDPKAQRRARRTGTPRSAFGPDQNVGTGRGMVRLSIQSDPVWQHDTLLTRRLVSLVLARSGPAGRGSAPSR